MPEDVQPAASGGARKDSGPRARTKNVRRVARVRSVPLHALEGFYWTGLLGGYTRAAEAMPYPITEPAVYQQVRKLERVVGRPLVAQAPPRRTVLTPEGRALHDFIAPFFRGLPDAVARARRGEGARVVVATDGAFALEVVAPAVAALLRKHPGLEVQVAEREAREVARLVATGEADLGLAILEPGGPALLAEPLLDVRIALAVPDGHALAERKRSPSPADLDGLPLCVYEKHDPGRVLVERAFRAAGIRLAVACEASTAQALRALVAAGVAPGFLPVPGKPGTSPPRPRRSRGVVFFDVTDLVPGDRVSYGLLSRPKAPRHSVVAELRALVLAASKERARSDP